MTPEELSQVSKAFGDALTSHSQVGFNPYTVVVSAAVGAFFGVLSSWLKGYRDSAASDGDILVETIDEAADLASEYWLAEKSDHAHAEARLTGLQTRISLLAQNFYGSVRRYDRRVISEMLPDLFDALTGGEFGSRSRSIDTIRARRAQELSALLAARIRVAFSQSWTLLSLVLRKIGLE